MQIASSYPSTTKNKDDIRFDFNFDSLQSNLERARGYSENKIYANKILRYETRIDKKPILDIGDLINYYDVNSLGGGHRFQAISKALNEGLKKATSGRIQDWTQLLDLTQYHKLQKLTLESLKNINSAGKKPPTDLASNFSLKIYANNVLAARTANLSFKINNIEELVYYYNRKLPDGGPSFKYLSQKLNAALYDASSGRILNWTQLLSPDGWLVLNGLQIPQAAKIPLSQNPIPKTPKTPKTPQASKGFIDPIRPLGASGFFLGSTIKPGTKKITIPDGREFKVYNDNIGLVVLFPESQNFFFATANNNIKMGAFAFKTITTISFNPKGSQIMNVGPGRSGNFGDSGAFWFVNFRANIQAFNDAIEKSLRIPNIPTTVRATANIGIVNSIPCPTGQSPNWRAGVGWQFQIVVRNGEIFLANKMGIFSLAAVEAVLWTVSSLLSKNNENLCKQPVLANSTENSANLKQENLLVPVKSQMADLRALVGSKNKPAILSKMNEILNANQASLNQLKSKIQSLEGPAKILAQNLLVQAQTQVERLRNYMSSEKMRQDLAGLGVAAGAGFLAYMEWYFQTMSGFISLLWKIFTFDSGQNAFG